MRIPWWSKMLAKVMARKTKPVLDGRDTKDYVGWDMHLDRALELNRRMPPLADVYYFSVPCSATVRNPDGTWSPKRGIEPLLVMRASLMGAYTGKTAGGITVDETWRENDGLVNTISATVPTGAPSRTLDRDNIEPGLWNVFQKVEGDHMWPQGGLYVQSHDIRPFYLDLLTMISHIQNRNEQSSITG